MTDGTGHVAPSWKSPLQAAARNSGHEIRNALNGLVVNLEVVRAQTAAAGLSAEPFMSHAVAQSEEAVRLAESAIAFLSLIVGAVGSDGMFLCHDAGANGFSIEAGADADKLANALSPLSVRQAFSVERSGSAVILRIPEDRSE